MKNRLVQGIKNRIIDSLARVANAMLSNPRIQSAINEFVINAMLSNPRMQSAINEFVIKYRNELWRITNVRPSSLDCHWGTIPNSILEQRMRLATVEAAEFIAKEIPDLAGLETQFDVLKYCLSQVTVEGLFLEFGVFSGTTINFIADNTPNIVHGFDSFEGLPDPWGFLPAGAYTAGGNMPIVRDNVKLYKGWFDDTLPKFLKDTPGNIAFLHIDSDLYSSAKTVLWALKDRIVPGTIIVFDEYINHPYWRDHEYKAFMEFIAEFGFDFDYISYVDRGYSVGIKIK